MDERTEGVVGGSEAAERMSACSRADRRQSECISANMSVDRKLEKLEINTATDKKWGIICSLTQTPMIAEVKSLGGR